MNKKLLIPAAALLSVLGFANIADAHNAAASGSCQGGVSWSVTNYDQNVTNTIVVKVDGVTVYQDLDFRASDTGTYATDKTVAHTWSVVVNAPGTQFDKNLTGSYQACVTVTTTTVAPTTTLPATTTVPTDPTTTVPVPTTSVVDVCCVVVPTTVSEDLPAPTSTTGPSIPCVQDAFGNWVFQGTMNPCQGPMTDISTVEPALPRTGSGWELLAWAAILGSIGGGLIFLTRHPAR